ncbi:VOC family protein [Saccharothrix violaceirubra]|uniref:Putative enzyme related to lactoylglutathione lyase n=1 Tax=Saccharothrix violaceirubra TaxID=413306 RepID=A0A7W7WXP0_9PSEU|nr:VOC family protein [Saccharothrix violaceirubra]MBB4967337.1 putative enzyme related to lactoylglutathione lyase [Saccharothrix violaceirubra]
MLRGLTTISYYADDVVEARDWYAKVLGVPAYFARPEEGTPSYVEFRVGDFEHELGIVDRKFAPHDTAGGPITYWAVDDLDASLERLVALGATPHRPPTAYGPGFVTASVVDPFGNVLGLMYNEHYLSIASAKA